MEYFTNRIVRTQNETEITRVKKLKKKTDEKKQQGKIKAFQETKKEIILAEKRIKIK